MVIRGAGELATGVALAFHAAGFGVIMTEIAQPLAVRLAVSFASAAYEGSHTVQGVRGQLTNAEGWPRLIKDGLVAVLVDPHADIVSRVSPAVVVDAIMAKTNLGTARVPGSVVIALGPGSIAGRDVDAVVETMRGHDLGRVIREGSAQADTGMPGEIAGRSIDRVLRAPSAGRVTHLKRIGDQVIEGEPIMRVGDLPVLAPFGGCLRGAISDQVTVARGMKIGDVDPRGMSGSAATVSDKARAVGRGALEAALAIGGERGLFRLLDVRRRSTPH